MTGRLVILYAQRLSTIAPLGLDEVHVETDQVPLLLGRAPIVLPNPLESLSCRIQDKRHSHASIGAREISDWLFSRGRPGEPVTPSQLGVLLKKIEICLWQACSSALFQLAIDLPAALTPGIHIDVAVQGQRDSNGDWTDYAADISRRNQP